MRAVDAKLCNRYAAALKVNRRRIKRSWKAMNWKERTAAARTMRRVLAGREQLVLEDLL